VDLLPVFGLAAFGMDAPAGRFRANHGRCGRTPATKSTQDELLPRGPRELESRLGWEAISVSALATR